MKIDNSQKRFEAYHEILSIPDSADMSVPVDVNSPEIISKPAAICNPK